MIAVSWGEPYVAPVQPKFVPPVKPLLATIMQVAQEHGVKMSELMGRRQHSRIVRIRHEAFWRCRMEHDWASSQDIANAFDRDRSTIDHGVKSHEQRILKGHMALLPNTNPPTSEREIGT